MQETSIEIDDLMYNAYSKFGDITNQHIDKLRLKHRLKVVQVRGAKSQTFIKISTKLFTSLSLQNLEDSTMRCVLRSVQVSTLFQGKELEDIFLVFKVEF